MRVLHVTSQLARNGTETFIMHLFKEAKKKGIIFDFLIFTTATGGYCEEAIKMGANIFRLPSRRTPLKYYKSLDTFFKERAKDYHAIHMSGNSMSSIAPLVFAKKYRIPIRIFHSHNSSCIGWHNHVLHRLNKHLIYYYATHFLACSKSALEWAFSNTLAAKEAQVINNGIDLHKYEFNAEKRKDIRTRLHWNGKLIVGNVGRFVPEKNHRFLIDIFSRLVKLFPDVHLVLIGEGPMMEIIRNQVNDLGLDREVSFLGVRTDVPDLLQGMDVFVMPSLFEGLPFVLIEAQASGIPIIASSSITDEVALTPTFNFESIKSSPHIWAQKITKLYSETERSNKNLEYMKDYNESECMQKVMEIYLDYD